MRLCNLWHYEYLLFFNSSIGIAQRGLGRKFEKILKVFEDFEFLTKSVEISGF